MPTATFGFQAEVRYAYEAAEGAGVNDVGGQQLKLLSDSNAECKLSVTTNTQTLRDIGNADAVAYVQGVKEFTLVTRSRMQHLAALYTLLQDLVVRQSNGRLKTFVLELATASDATTKAWYTAKGCKPDEVVVDVDQDGVYVLEVTWKPLDVPSASAQPSYVNATRQTAAIGTAYYTFTGAKFEAPGGTALAYAVSKGGLRVQHALEAVKDAGLTTVKTYAEGPRSISFMGDCTTDDGGKPLFDAAVAGTEVDIIVWLGQTSGHPKITLTGTRLPDFEQSYDDQAAVVTTSIERPAKGITFGAVP
jgi:hypothetical protein